MKYITAYILLGCILFFAGCSADSEGAKEHSDHSAEDHTEHAAMDMETGEPSEGSVYHANSTWKNRHGEELQLKDLRGKVQVIAMAYTSCDYACPKIVKDMQEIRNELPQEVRDVTNFSLVSIDPERDTPERLKQFGDENNLSEEHWMLLNGSEGDVLELSALLGFRFQRISDTDFSHSNMITVLDKEGEIVHQRKQLADRQTDVIKQITKVAL